MRLRKKSFYNKEPKNQNSEICWGSILNTKFTGKNEGSLEENRKNTWSAGEKEEIEKPIGPKKKAEEKEKEEEQVEERGAMRMKR